MTEDIRNLVTFIATLAAIVLLSKIGGTGSDLAIMTGLVGILGMLARPARSTNEKPSDTPTGKPGDPVAVKEDETP